MPTSTPARPPAPPVPQTPSPTAVPTASPTALPTPAPTTVPTAAPTMAIPPTPAPQHMWGAIIGQCTLDGSCVQSANYPQNYGARQKCTVDIDEANSAPIVVESFDVESYFDYLVVDGVRYSGRAGPDGVAPTGSMLWSSDSSVQRSGWRLCMPTSTPAPPPAPPVPQTPSPTAIPTASPTVVPTASPTAAPTAMPTASPTALPTPAPTTVPTAAPTMAIPPTPAPQHMWGAIIGQCTLDGSCVQSANYPQNYLANQKCTVEIDEANSA